MGFDLLNTLLNIPSSDPDEQRRARLLNVLLLGVGCLNLIAVLLTIILITPENRQASILLIVVGSIFLIGLIITFIINRFWSNTVAGWLFLGLLGFAFAFGDAPEEVVLGRQLYLFTIPILMASVLLRPFSSFIMASLVGLLVNFIALNASLPLNFVDPIGFFAIALVSWLAARSLEQALRDLRVTNEVLEARSAELEVTNVRLREENAERRRAERELAEQARVLSRTNAELQQFAYVSTHDLREPLRKVRSYAELLERRYQGQLDEKADKYIDYVVSGATRMQVLITDLLAYLAVDNKEMFLEETDLNVLLAQVLTDIDMLVQENTAVITHDPLPQLEVDPSQLRTLLQNLISNALKFHGEEPPQVHVGVERQGDEWLFSVADNGIGIEEQYLERIFVIFQRLHTKETYPGTGIGLAICKKVVENHNGRIWLTSTPGQGTTFYFTLPV